MSNDQKLSQLLKIKFGTAPYEPNAHQLDKIKHDIQILVAKGTTPSETDWASIVRKYCPSAGSHIYAGLDTSDLITLMKLATNNR